MIATFDPDTRTYTLQVSAQDAHYLIWGGYQEQHESAERALRLALLDAEDKQMPNHIYKELFG